jgi:hypothetical protein
MRFEYVGPRRSEGNTARWSKADAEVCDAIAIAIAKDTK